MIPRANRRPQDGKEGLCLRLTVEDRFTVEIGCNQNIDAYVARVPDSRSSPLGTIRKRER